jgi:hypothetical protein
MRLKTMFKKTEFQPIIRIAFRAGVKHPRMYEWGKGLTILRSERNDSIPENLTPEIIKKAVNNTYPEA